MRSATILRILPIGLLVLATACETSDKGASRPVDAQGSSPGKTCATVTPAPGSNPTALAGRGEPSLDDAFRPAAWVYVDGQAGKFIDRDGNPQVQWVIDTPVSPSPTFRVQAYGPLMGTPRDFACTLDAHQASEGTTVAYAIKAAEGTFKTGHDYSLLHPGEGFTIRNRLTGDVVSEIAPLEPGSYLIAAGIKNLETGKEALAVTQFVVGDSAGE
jgi:hypothetical protein